MLFPTSSPKRAWPWRARRSDRFSLNSLRCRRPSFVRSIEPAGEGGLAVADGCDLRVGYIDTDGVSLGEAWDVAGRPGSEAHDEIFWSEDRGWYRETNRAGGLEGSRGT